MDSLYIYPPLPNTLQRIPHVSYVQRDGRTTVWNKKLYIWTCLILALCATVLIGGMVAINHRCKNCSDKVREGVTYWSYFMIILMIIVSFVNIYIILHPQWAWLKALHTPVPCDGRQVLDCEPNFLAEEGYKMVRQTQKDAMKLNSLIDKFDNSLRSMERSR